MFLTEAARVLCRALVGGSLVWAGIAKAMNDQDVRVYWYWLGQMRILRGSQIRDLAFVLPYVEVAVGLLVVCGLFTRAAFSAALALLVMFTVVVGLAAAKGIEIPHCACFGGFDTGDHRVVLLRNVLLCAAAVLGL